MSYSSRHKEFANWLNFSHNINPQDILNYPENYLGSNYKEVLNLWFYLDSLSSKQNYVYWTLYWAVDYETRKNVVELAKEVINPEFIDYLGSEELELIASHLYIERGIPFTYLPLLFDL